MTPESLAVLASGLVTSVGLAAPAACAAIRAGIANPTPTKFIDSAGELIVGHSVTVPADDAWSGRPRLVDMAALAIQECLSRVPRERWTEVPLMLCVAEKNRPGRLEEIEDRLLREVQESLGTRFGADSQIVPYGRVGVCVALASARRLLSEGRASLVLIVGVDTLLNSGTMMAFHAEDRLLTSVNSNGFMPGEAASAVLVGASTTPCRLLITGLGFDTEPAHIDAELPLRGDGLSRAIMTAAREAGCGIDSIAFRITDLSGEQYYFKEAALAIARCLRTAKDDFDIWHPAECTGEVGAAIGPMILAVALAAVEKGYARGSRILCHTSNDAGQRAAMIAQAMGANA